MEIKNKNILITGGLGSLGKAISEYLYSLEAQHIFIFDKQASNQKNTFQIDVSSEKEVQAALNQIDKIDILINCAGEIYSEPILNVLTNKIHSIESWERILTRNLTSSFIMGSYTAQKMYQTRTKGVIINFSSVSAKGNAGQAAYSAAKAGIEALTKVQAKEFGLFKIRSCAIAPGFIETPSTHQALSDSLLQFWKKQSPLKTLGQTEHILLAIKFIIENDFLTGEILHIDGGVQL